MEGSRRRRIVSSAPGPGRSWTRSRGTASPVSASTSARTSGLPVSRSTISIVGGPNPLASQRSPHSRSATLTFHRSRPFGRQTIFVAWRALLIADPLDDAVLTSASAARPASRPGYPCSCAGRRSGSGRATGRGSAAAPSGRRSAPARRRSSTHSGEGFGLHRAFASATVADRKLRLQAAHAVTKLAQLDTAGIFDVLHRTFPSAQPRTTALRSPVPDSADIATALVTSMIEAISALQHEHKAAVIAGRMTGSMPMTSTTASPYRDAETRFVTVEGDRFAYRIPPQRPSQPARAAEPLGGQSRQFRSEYR